MPNINNIPTTQYVGPKIVPHIWNPVVWSATTQYDALAVVQYNGDGYVSRYIPPVGTPPTDDEYWVKWADFNAQLANLQQTVDTFDSRIDGAETSVGNLSTSLNTEITNRTNADTALGNRITTETTARTNADTALGNRITVLEQSAVTKKEVWVVIGDSFTDTSQTSFNNWVEIIQTMRPNITIKNYARSGAGYVHATNTVFPTQAEQAVNDTSFSNSDVNRVIVYGGINDIASSDPLSSIFTAAQNLANTIKNNFVNAEVGFYMNWSANVDMTAAKQQYFSYISNAINHIGYQLTLDSAFLLMNYRVRDVYQSDSVHPNQLGHGIIAAYMLNGYKGGFRNRMQGALTAAAINTIQTPRLLSQNPDGVLTAKNEPLDSVSYENGYLNITMPQRTYQLTGLTSNQVGFSFPLNSDFKKYAPCTNATVEVLLAITRGYHAVNPRAWISGNSVLMVFDKLESNAWPTDETGVDIQVAFNAHIQLF